MHVKVITSQMWDVFETQCRHGPKIGGSAPLWGGSWVPIEHNVAWVEAYLPTKWHLDPSNHLASPQQIWAENWGCAPLGRGAGSLSNTMWPWPRPTCMSSFTLIHPTVWSQYTTVTDRRGQDRQTDRQENGPLRQHSPQFSAHVCCGQMAAWIKMSLGMELVLGPAMFIVAKRLDG